MKFQISRIDPAPIGHGKVVPDRRVTPYTVRLYELWRLVTTPRASSSKAWTMCWSPARFANDERKLANVRSLSCLVYDIDDGATIAQATNPLKQQGIAHAMHTSWSHGPHATKFRIVIPLRRPCPPMAWPRLWHHYKTAGVDPACKDASRAFYLPATPNPDHFAAYVWAPRGSKLLAPDYATLPPTPLEKKRWRYRKHMGNKPHGPAIVDRHEAAHRLGMHIVDRPTGSVAKNGLCPSCGRASVYFFLEPDQFTGAMCQHRSSCGWAGPLRCLYTP